jgi:hypothetical protein
VIETKGDAADRKAVGQILGYMGWISAKLWTAGQSVREILIATKSSAELRLAFAPVPSRASYWYEISFAVEPLTPERPRSVRSKRC